MDQIELIWSDQHFFKPIFQTLFALISDDMAWLALFWTVLKDEDVGQELLSKTFVGGRGGGSALKAVKGFARTGSCANPAFKTSPL